MHRARSVHEARVLGDPYQRQPRADLTCPGADAAAQPKQNMDPQPHASAQGHVLLANGTHVKHVNPVTLRFTEAGCESAYQERQRLLHAANDPWIHNMHLVVALLHLYITAMRLEGSVFTPLSAYIIMPYSSLALGHWLAARTAWYKRHRTACALAFEALYTVVCTDGLPIWVLVEAVDLKSVLRDLVLGSGVLLSYWFSFFSNKPFIADFVAIPLHFAALAATLIKPTCKYLDRTPLGRSTMDAVADALNAVAAPQLRGKARNPCANILLLWQAAGCGLLISVRYHMERRRRAAFVAPAVLAEGWLQRVRMPVGALQFQLALVLQLFAVVWLLLQG